MNLLGLTFASFFGKAIGGFLANPVVGVVMFFASVIMKLFMGGGSCDLEPIADDTANQVVNCFSGYPQPNLADCNDKSPGWQSTLGTAAVSISPDRLAGWGRHNPADPTDGDPTNNSPWASVGKNCRPPMTTDGQVICGQAGLPPCCSDVEPETVTFSGSVFACQF